MKSVVTAGEPALSSHSNHPGTSGRKGIVS